MPLLLWLIDTEATHLLLWLIDIVAFRYKGHASLIVAYRYSGHASLTMTHTQITLRPLPLSLSLEPFCACGSGPIAVVFPRGVRRPYVASCCLQKEI